MNLNLITQAIDHTLLKPDATHQAIETLCNEAVQYRFFSVCVHPFFCRFAKQHLKGASPKVVAVCGFPLGIAPFELKRAEIEYLTDADEIDFVINLSYIKEGKWDLLLREMKALRSVTSKPLKAIIECCLLTDEEKRKAAEAVVSSGIDFVKTSTGFAHGGATPEDVRLLADVVKGKAQVKASGGIRTLAQAEEYLKLGATRLGTSNGVAIIKDLRDGQAY